MQKLQRIKDNNQKRKINEKLKEQAARMGSTIEHVDRRKQGQDNQPAEHHREQQHTTTAGEKGSRNR